MNIGKTIHRELKDDIVNNISNMVFYKAFNETQRPIHKASRDIVFHPLFNLTSNNYEYR